MTLAEHFRIQARACDDLGSPFTARLLDLLADRMHPDGPVTRRLFDWPEARLRDDAVALRLAGALHALVLTGQDEALVAAYPPDDMPEEPLWKAVSAAFVHHQAHILHWLDSAPQTNEVRRAAALILAASHLARLFPGMPLRVSELGASAGLNLTFDRFALAGFHLPADPVLTLSPEITGPLPAPHPFTITDRRGVDLNPLDPGNPEDVLRLRSYIWPDQPDRMARTLAALAAAGPAPDRGDAAAWLAERMEQPVPGQIDMLYHTIAWQYFPDSTAHACRATIDRATARATPDTPFAWLSFEGDGHAPGAPVTLKAWPGDHTIPLGRMDYHGRWLQLMA